MATIDSVQTSLRLADDWEKKGQPTWVSKCLSSALMGFLQIAVSEQDDPLIGKSWLTSLDIDSILHKQLETLHALGAEVTRGRLPSSVIGGNYHPIVFAHLSWCLEQFELGKAFVSFAEHRDVDELGTVFWREYARGLGALVRVEPYHPIELKLKGQEKYWMGYLYLIEAVCNERGVADAVAESRRKFAARNSDKNIKDDAYRIEGSGNHPVKWDFRLTGLSNYISCRTVIHAR